MRTVSLKLSLLLLVLTTLYGCGVAHVRTEVASANWSGYQAAYVKDVRVYSKEEAAKDNQALQDKMVEWHAQSLTQINNYLGRSRLTLLTDPPVESSRTLAVEIDTEVRYGNRALRYFVGFGAGRGGVTSTLTATDADSGAVKFQAESKSNLSVGIGGGDMGRVLKSNITELIKQFGSESGLAK